MTVPELSGKQKAAAVLLSVDSKTAAAVLKNLSEKDLSTLTREMHGLSDVQPQAATAVLHEFTIRSGEDRGITVNPAALRQSLELAVGHDGARHLLQEFGADDSEEKIFHPLRDLPQEEIYKLLADEHPQTAAVILSHVDAKLAAATLNLFPPETRSDIVRRMAASQQADATLLKKFSDILRNRRSSAAGEVRKTPEELRLKRVAEIINLLGPAPKTRFSRTWPPKRPKWPRRSAR